MIPSLLSPDLPRRRPIPDLFQDTFTDADATQLSTHAADIGGLGWDMLTNEWEINANQCRKIVDGSGDGQVICLRHTSAANVWIACDMAIEDDTDAGIVFNYVDDQNYWMFVHNVFFDNWALYKVTTAGGFEIVANWIDDTGNGTHRVVVNANGDDIHCSVDGVLRVTYSESDRPHKTSQSHGLRVYTADTSTHFDNYRIRPATVGL
jgi:hypothetical protein